MRAIVAVFVVVLASSPVFAEAWYQGKYGTNRIVHTSIGAAGGISHLLTDGYLKTKLAPSVCRWCEPPAFDVAVRGALVWRNLHRAEVLSDLDGYVLAAVVNVGLLSIGTLSSGPATLARGIDDGIPVLEAVVLSNIVRQIVKYSVGRQRPAVHYGESTRPHGLDDNMSFLSGHTCLAFALATSAGVVAHERGYRIEPAIWIAGMSIAGTTAYFRIAADQHYLSDVLVGSAVGVASGLLAPLLMRRQTDLTTVSTRQVITLGGSF